MTIATDMKWFLEEQSPDQMASWVDHRVKDVRSLRSKVDLLVWGALGDLSMSPSDLQRKVSEHCVRGLYLEELVKSMVEAWEQANNAGADARVVVDAIKEAGAVFTEELRKLQDLQKLVNHLVTTSQRRMDTPA